MPTMPSQQDIQGFYDWVNRSPMSGQQKQDIIKNFQAQLTALGTPATPTYPDPAKSDAFNPTFLNNLFNTAQGNLSQYGSQAAGRARQIGATQAASRSLANPLAFINQQGQAASQPYAAQSGQIEQARAGATIDQQKMLYDALVKKFLAERGILEGDRNYELARQQLDAQLQGNQANAYDWISALLPIATAPIDGGSSILGKILFPG